MNAEMTLRERIDVLEEENRQLRERVGMSAPDEFVLACMSELRLSRQQAAILYVLIKRERATQEFVMSAISTDSAADFCDELVRVQVYNLRRRLKHTGVEIETLWGFGYRLSPENRAKVLALLGLEQP